MEVAEVDEPNFDGMLADTPPMCWRTYAKVAPRSGNRNCIKVYDFPLRLLYAIYAAVSALRLDSYGWQNRKLEPPTHY